MPYYYGYDAISAVIYRKGVRGGMDNDPVIFPVELPDGTDYLSCRCNGNLIVFVNSALMVGMQYKALLKALEEDETKIKPF